MEVGKLHDHIIQVIPDITELLYFVVFQFLDTIIVYLNRANKYLVLQKTYKVYKYVDTNITSDSYNAILITRLTFRNCSLFASLHFLRFFQLF